VIFHVKLSAGKSRGESLVSIKEPRNGRVSDIERKGSCKPQVFGIDSNTRATKEFVSVDVALEDSGFVHERKGLLVTLHYGI
jgi:hypothetical protein